MPRNWAQKLLVLYAKVLYAVTGCLGLAVGTWQHGEWQPVTSGWRLYSCLASTTSLAAVFGILVHQVRRMPFTVLKLGIELFLPTFLYILAGCLLTLYLTFMRLRHRQQLHDFIGQLLILQKKVSRQFTSQGSIFTSYHYKAFAFFAGVATVRLVLYYAQIVMYHVEAPGIMLSVNSAITVFVDLHHFSFSLLYMLALLLFDASCYRLNEFLIRILTPESIKKSQERIAVLPVCRDLLINLAAWQRDCNRFCTPALFLYYGMFFVETLTEFYVVFSSFFGGFDDGLWNYGVTLLKLVQPHMLNLIAEHATSSFQHASDAVLRVACRRRSALRWEEHHLQLEAGRMSFCCGRFFRVNRALTITFYAEVLSLIITLMQFHLGKH